VIEIGEPPRAFGDAASAFAHVAARREACGLASSVTVTLLESAAIAADGEPPPGSPARRP